MANTGVIHLSEKTQINWMRGNGDGELFATVYVHGKVLRISDRPVSGWWRMEDPEKLETHIRLAFKEEIETAEKEE